MLQNVQLLTVSAAFVHKMANIEDDVRDAVMCCNAMHAVHVVASHFCTCKILQLYLSPSSEINVKQIIETA